MTNSWNSRVVLLEYFAKSLGPKDRVLTDQLISGGLVRNPYVITAQLLDHLTESNQEVEKDLSLESLLTHMDELTKKVREIEV